MTVIQIVRSALETIPKELIDSSRLQHFYAQPEYWEESWRPEETPVKNYWLKWTRDELRRMDQRTRKLMTRHKALHPRDGVDRLYVPKKEGGRGLTSIEDSVDTSIQRLEDYTEKHERGLITANRNNTDNTINNRNTITTEVPVV